MSLFTKTPRNRSRHTGVVRAALSGCIAVALLTGCSPDEGGALDAYEVTSVDAGAPQDIELSDVDVPEFSGPWAGEFANVYRRTQTDFERAILEDGEISDQEIAEAKDKFRTCLSDYGFSNIVMGDDGSFSVTNPADLDAGAAEERVSTCSVESGEQTVLALHSWIRRNPDNLDENTIMAACLVNKGVVDVAYTAEDYARDVPTLRFPYLAGVDGATAFNECNADPLGLFQ